MLFHASNLTSTTDYFEQTESPDICRMSSNTTKKVPNGEAVRLRMSRNSQMWRSIPIGLVQTKKAVHLERWTNFFKTYSVGQNRSIQFYTEISGNFGWMNRAQRQTGRQAVWWYLLKTIGWGECTARFPKPVPYLRPKTEIFPTQEKIRWQMRGNDFEFTEKKTTQSSVMISEEAIISSTTNNVPC